MSAAAEPPAVFFADHKNLSRLDPATNSVSASAALPAEPESLAPAQDGAVWVLANKRLLRYDATPGFQREVDIKAQLGWFEEPKRLVSNPYDGSLWVAAEKTLVRLDAEGRVLGSWKAPEEIKAIALDPNESIWTLTKKQLIHLSPAFAVLHSVDPTPLLKEPEKFVLDRLGNRLWMSNGKELLAIDLGSFQVIRLLDVKTLPLGTASSSDEEGSKVKELAVHPIFGTLWAVTKNNLLILDRDGNFLKQVDLTPRDLGETEAIAFDSSMFSLWLGGKKAIGRFQSNGEFLARIPVENELEAIAVASFKLLPILSLLTPSDGTVTNNAFSPIRYGLGANCTGTPCFLDPDYTKTFRLGVDLNGQPIGKLFTLTPEEATLTPTTRWPEGVNRLNAQATDRYGHLSEKVASQFTIDTVPPAFVSLNPIDGSGVTTGLVTIQGSLDDPTASVLLFDASGMVISMGAYRFAFAVVLKNGWNAFTLVARDAAGNQTTIPLRIYLNTLSATVTEPVSGSTVNTDSLLVSGSFMGPENTGITVNGIVALIDGDKFYVNNLPLTGC